MADQEHKRLLVIHIEDNEKWSEVTRDSLLQSFPTAEIISFEDSSATLSYFDSDYDKKPDDVSPILIVDSHLGIHENEGKEVTEEVERRLRRRGIDTPPVINYSSYPTFGLRRYQIKKGNEKELVAAIIELTGVEPA